MSDTKRATNARNAADSSPQSADDATMINETNLAMVRSWAQAIPDAYRPDLLLEAFPHILWRLMSQWESPKELHGVFNDISLDARGERRGLPKQAMRELNQLWSYYFELLDPSALKQLEPEHGINPYLVRR